MGRAGRNPADAMTIHDRAADAELEALQRDALRYFSLWTNSRTGMVLDKTEPNWPSSIA